MRRHGSIGYVGRAMRGHGSIGRSVRRHNSDWMVPPARACNVEQAMRRHGSAVYVVALAQTQSREDARCPELARLSAAREADG